MNRISFDIDGCLMHNPMVQKLCMCLLMDPANEVFIITRRYGYIHPEAGDEHMQVYALAQKFGIKKENIHFTNREYKVKKIKELNIDIHYDDDHNEIGYIRQLFPKCHGFVVHM